MWYRELLVVTCIVRSAGRIPHRFVRALRANSHELPHRELSTALRV